jgi:hypothetical protein
MRRALLGLAVACLAAGVAAGRAAAGSPAKRFAVSLGDSFSAGVQPPPGPVRRSLSYPKVSYAGQLVAPASRLLHERLELVMLACGGATTQSIRGAEVKPCDRGAGGFELPYANRDRSTS